MRKVLNESPKVIFKAWHLTFRKNYSLDSPVAIQKYKAFKENLIYIKEVNSKSLGFTLGLGPWADLTNEEYKNQVLSSFQTNHQVFEGKPNYQKKTNVNFFDDEDDDLMRNLDGKGIDWSNLYNYIEEENLQCDNSWSSIAIGVLEGVTAVKERQTQITKLSNQQLIDCAKKTKPCEGGSLGLAFQYLVENGSISKQNYQMKKGDNKCNIESSNNAVKPKDYIYEIFYEKDQAIKYLKNGPYASVLDASSRDFQLYEEGTLPLSLCKDTNHGVIVVGFNNDSITIRNNWGDSWGTNGNASIKRTSTPLTCFLEFMVYQPLI